MTAQGLLDALEPRSPKTPAPGRRCSSAGGGRGLAKPTPGRSEPLAGGIIPISLTFYFKNLGSGRSRMKT